MRPTTAQTSAWLLVGLLLAAPASLGADDFQFLRETEDDVYFLSDARVQVFDGKGRELFDGRTDSYGRIRIELEPGEYRARVTEGKKQWSPVPLTLDGDDRMKEVELR